MSSAKKILWALLGLFIAIQFIRPARNSSMEGYRTDFITHFDAPPKVAGALKKSCYDCHSNNTRYPWYASVQPMGWLLANHVEDGKKELNFSEFASFSKRRQLSKLKSVQNSIKDGSMPLSSYTMLHSDAKLSEESKSLIVQWTGKILDSLSEK